MMLTRRETLITSAKAIAAFSASSFGLTSCGGGGGGGGDDEVVVAPRSLDLLQLDFFGSFTLKFYRLSGTADNEFGAVDYVVSGGSFFLGIAGSGGGSLGREVEIPVLLQDVRYEYRRLSEATGLLRLTYFNNQVYPFTPATMMNPRVLGAEMFWSTDDVEVLFVVSNAGGFIGDSSHRVDGVTYYTSIFGTPPSFDTFPFNSPDVLSLRLSGSPVPIGYNPYLQFNDSTSSAAVWTSLNGRTVDFASPSGFAARISFVLDNTVDNPPEISGVPTETGRILIEIPDEGVQGGGEYSYRRTGGSRATIGIRYTQPGPPSTIKLRTFDMGFYSLQAGTFTDVLNEDTVGNFRQDLIIPNP